MKPKILMEKRKENNKVAKDEEKKLEARNPTQDARA